MGYELHIRRTPPLVLEEWEAAVGNTTGMELSVRDAVATNPRTGEVIRIGRLEGDAELDLGDGSVIYFRWYAGQVSFRATKDFNDENGRLRAIARQLAGTLGAIVQGDEGEVYE